MKCIFRYDQQIKMVSLTFGRFDLNTTIKSLWVLLFKAANIYQEDCDTLKTRQSDQKGERDQQVSLECFHWDVESSKLKYLNHSFVV